MPVLRQSQLPRLTDPHSFLWATGIEDTFITEPWPKTGRTLDEYELTAHYERWHDDLGLIPQLGASTARYGIPWHRIQPRRGAWEWDFVDRALERLLELGIEPIVDLVHYGLPRWIDGAYLHPDFPSFMSDYAARVAERFRGRIFAYTPLNEPRITAWYCGRLGWWPPFQRGWRGFIRVMLGACRGIVETVRTLRAIDPEILPVHVDATDLYRTEASPAAAAGPVSAAGSAEEDDRRSNAPDAPGDLGPPQPNRILDQDPLAREAAHRQEIVFLALDLISGRIQPGHPLWDWLLRNGFTDNDAAWFRARAIDLPLIGLNLYPMFTLKTLRRTPAGALRWRMAYAGAGIIDVLGEMYWRRYHAPVFISETASVGSVRRRAAWLDDSVAAVRRLREKGVPMIGYTWWPLFALVTWGYRQGTHPPAYYLKQMGLWDLDPGLERRRTPLVARFHALASGGSDAVGTLYGARMPATEPAVH